MANISKIKSSIIINELNIIGVALDDGTLQILSGIQPNLVDTGITTQIVLATLSLSATAFQPATLVGNQLGNQAVIVANPITQDVSADNTGVATWFRVFDFNGVAIVDGNVGKVDEALIISNDQITQGDIITIPSWEIKRDL